MEDHVEDPEYAAAVSYCLDQAHVRAESLFPTEWDFGELDPRDAKHGEILAYLEHLKSFWQPHHRLEMPGEWTHLILPPEPETADQSVDLDVWFPLSLISTILSPISSQILPVPASELINRATSPDYIGPQFPVRYPPGKPDFEIISAMNDLLLYEGPSTGALYYLAALLIETHGCQLKIHPDMRFPSRLGAKSPSIDFALVPEWKPTSESMLRRSRKAPVCFSSPAITIGIQLEDSQVTSGGLTSQELMQLAHAVQPHLVALLGARHHQAPATVPGPSDPPACIFGIAFRDMTLFLVAHIAYLDESYYRYRSLVVDQIAFPPYVPGDGEGLLGRLRIIVALLTIKHHTGRLASLWERATWPATIIDADLTLVHNCTGILTPSPSEYRDPYGLYLDFSSGSKRRDLKPEEGDINLEEGESNPEIYPTPSEIVHSIELVDAWLPGIQDTGEILDTIVPDT
ncbi:hypothetical protein B0H14DRAFT_2841983 [Mycena olivaceomarginata]|nr:hypothetical protein B0H14DRAFT_2841983 [Mycena olivaceomarginata]